MPQPSRGQPLIYGWASAKKRFSRRTTNITGGIIEGNRKLFFARD